MHAACDGDVPDQLAVLHVMTAAQLEAGNLECAKATKSDVEIVTDDGRRESLHVPATDAELSKAPDKWQWLQSAEEAKRVIIVAGNPLVPITGHENEVVDSTLVRRLKVDAATQKQLDEFPTPSPITPDTTAPVAKDRAVLRPM